MKGWQFNTTNQPLELVEKPDPTVTAGRVVIDVKAAGLCHSDVGALRDKSWLEIIEYTPIIMGHEVAGVITEVGEGVTDYKVGGKVGICPVSKVGMGILQSNINTATLILKEVNLLGSNGGNVDDIAEVYKMFASGELDPILTEITFDEIPEGLERLKRYEVEGRLVAKI